MALGHCLARLCYALAESIFDNLTSGSYPDHHKSTITEKDTVLDGGCTCGIAPILRRQ